MQRMKPQSITIIISLILIGSFQLWNTQRLKSRCLDRATELAVNAYPMSAYPKTSQRASLQADYEQQYIGLNC